MSKRVFVIHEKDNVATVVSEEIKEGKKIELRDKGSMSEIKIQDDIEYGHKFAKDDINKGEKIIKYGLPIGQACRNIAKGEHVHAHNIEAIRARGDKAN